MSKNKGFTLLEMLIVLSIISFCSLLTLKNTYKIGDKFTKYQILTDVAKCQNDAMFYRLSMDYVNSDVYSDYEIYFNGRGNVNMAQTIDVNQSYEFIVSLGCGRLYENKEGLLID